MCALEELVVLVAHLVPKEAVLRGSFCVKIDAVSIVARNAMDVAVAVLRRPEAGSTRHSSPSRRPQELSLVAKAVHREDAGECILVPLERDVAFREETKENKQVYSRIHHEKRFVDHHLLDFPIFAKHVVAQQNTLRGVFTHHPCYIDQVPLDDSCLL